MYCPILWECRFLKINFIYWFLQEITLKALKMWKMVDHSNKSIVDEKNYISSKEQLTSKPLTGQRNKAFWQPLISIKSYFPKVRIFFLILYFWVTKFKVLSRFIQTSSDKTLWFWVCYQCKKVKFNTYIAIFLELIKNGDILGKPN